MTTRRDIRRRIGNYRYKGRRLLEVFGVPTATTSTTYTVAELAVYANNTTEFDRYGVSHIADSTGVITDRVVTSFDQTIPRVTFTPSTGSALSTSSVVELWQEGLNATRVNDYIDAAIDMIAEESLQRWTSADMAYESGRALYPIFGATLAGGYAIPKYITEVWYGQSPSTGWPASKATAFVQLRDATATSRLAQGFKVASSGWYAGAVAHLDVVCATAFTLQADFFASSGGVPTGSSLATVTIPGGNSANDNGLRPFFFKFAKPVYLTADTQYWLSLTSAYSVGGSTYVRWLADTDTAELYASGGTATYDSGSAAWTAQTTRCFAFHVIPYRESWVRLQDSEWDLQIMGNSNDSTVRGSTSLRLLFEQGRALPTQMGGIRSIADGTPLLVTGLRAASRPATDTSVMDVPRAYVEAKALSALVLDMDPGLSEQAAFFAKLASQELANHPVKTALPAGARSVYYSVS